MPTQASPVTSRTTVQLPVESLESRPAKLPAALERAILSALLKDEPWATVVSSAPSPEASARLRSVVASLRSMGFDARSWVEGTRDGGQSRLVLGIYLAGSPAAPKLLAASLPTLKTPEVRLEINRLCARVRSATAALRVRAENSVDLLAGKSDEANSLVAKQAVQQLRGEGYDARLWSMKDASGTSQLHVMVFVH